MAIFQKPSYLPFQTLLIEIWLGWDTTATNGTPNKVLTPLDVLKPINPERG